MNTTIRFCCFSLLIFSTVVHSSVEGWKSHLQQGEVNAMLEQGDSLVWLGTHGGLVKINRQKHDTTFYHKGNSGLPDNDVKCLALDTAGALWIASEQTYLTCYNGTEWKVITLGTTRVYIQGYVQDLQIDQKNTVYVGTYFGLYTYDSTLTYYNNTKFGELDGGGRVASIAIAPDTSVWLAAADGIVHIKDTVWTFYNPENSGLPSTSVNALAFDKQGVLWIATTHDSRTVNQGGLARFDGTEWLTFNIDTVLYKGTNLPPVGSNTVSDLFIDDNDVKWCITRGQLVSFENGVWKAYSSPLVKAPVNLRRFAGRGRDSTLWLSAGVLHPDQATAIGSSYRIHGDTVEQVAISSSGLPPACGALNAIAIDKNNTWWIGTTYRGLVRFDGTSWTTFDTLNSGIPSQEITHLAAGTSDQIWIATPKGISCKNGDTWKTWDSAGRSLPSNHITSLTIDIAGLVWVGTATMGILSFDGTSWKRYYTIGSGICGNNITGLAPSPDGALWIATDGDGIDRMKDTRFDNFTASRDSIYSNNIATIFAHREGAGVLVYETHTVGKSYVFVNNKWSEISFNALMDARLFTSHHDNGGVWAVCDEELVRVHYDATNQKVVQDAVLGIFNSGLSSPWISALARDSAGNMVIGTGGQIDMYLCGDPTTTAPRKIVPAPTKITVGYRSSRSTGIITYTLGTAGNVQFGIYSLTGRMIMRTPERFHSSGTHDVVCPAALPRGNYLWRIKTGKSVVTGKLPVL